MIQAPGKIPGEREMKWSDSTPFRLVLDTALSSAVLAGDGRVRTQTADASCPDQSGNLYVDCGNGTVTDNRTGLVWLQDGNCLEISTPDGRSFQRALELVAILSDKSEDFNHCGLSDNSSPGEWRLPSIDEWQAMIADAAALGCVGAFAPAITSDSGTSCWQEGPGNSFTNIEAEDYWAASQPPDATGRAWIAQLDDGSTAFQKLKTGTANVWPVRGGQ